LRASRPASADGYDGLVTILLILLVEESRSAKYVNMFILGLAGLAAAGFLWAILRTAWIYWRGNEEFVAGGSLGHQISQPTVTRKVAAAIRRRRTRAPRRPA